MKGNEATTATSLTMATLLDAKRKLEASLAMRSQPPDIRCLPWPKKRARRHRRRRVDKKWLKRYGTAIDTSVDQGQVYLFKDPFSGLRYAVMYPGTYDRYRRALEYTYGQKQQNRLV